MADGSKRLFAAATLASEARAKYRFLPETALPSDLPDGEIAIADMANAFGVTHRTLHFYEEKHLISADRHGLMRIYGTDDVLRMAVITVCRETGMSIAVIQEIMERLDDAETPEDAETTFRAALNTRKREIMAEMSGLNRQMQKVADLLDYDSTVDAPHANDDDGLALLTPEERRCLELMAEGRSTAEVARSLELKYEETEALEAAIMEKLGAGDRFQAIAKGMLLGLAKH
ncbi:MAG: MerR family transcriptional regulator [Rhizobiaceae bacterium]|nr:MerR family transcriptional regulator [Rhizobiaceae bacterium]